MKGDMRIDSHQHFWVYDPQRDSWMNEDMQAIRRDFLPQDLFPLLQQNNIDGCIAVQAGQSTNETDFLLQLADKNDIIKGVVGWIDLRGGDIEQQLEKYSSYAKLKGFRHIVQDEPQENFLLRDDFCNGISLLKNFKFTYDILVYSSQLKSVIEFIRLFPEQHFVIDHIGKPDIKNRKIEAWQNDMKGIAKHTNVYCKLSGMVTEANVNRWTVADFTPYIEFILESFGTGRVMFGSDWPVCLLAASYSQCCEILEHGTEHLNQDEKRKLWGENATRFYHI
jgi:L-fuconolactonase